jgi:hypothetical protein
MALALAACSPSATPSPSPPSAALPSPSPIESLAPSPASPPPAAAEVPFPDVSLIAAAATGELHALRAGRWERLAQPCPSGLATYSASIKHFHVSANGLRAWFQCDVAGPPGQTAQAFVFDLSTKQLLEVSGTSEMGLGPISPDGRFAIAAAVGDCSLPAPSCQTKHLLIDLGTSARHEILPSDYWLGLEMRWTSFGLTYFLPECSSSGCPGPDKAGTYRWDGAAWTKVSTHRVVDAASAERMLLERRRSLTDVDAPVTVIERTGTNERVLSHSGLTELGLALDESGVTVFRPDGRRSTTGAYVRYEGGREVKATSGGFLNPYHYTRSGNWLITVGDRFATGPSTVLQAYSLDRHLSATMTTDFPIVALAALGR